MDKEPNPRTGFSRGDPRRAACLRAPGRTGSFEWLKTDPAAGPAMGWADCKFGACGTFWLELSLPSNAWLQKKLVPTAHAKFFQSKPGGRIIGVGCAAIKTARVHSKMCKVAYVFDL